MRYVMVLIVLMGCGDRGISANERTRLLVMRAVWITAARAERCPRPALRTPITGDGSARLRTLNDQTSPEWRCLARVKELRTELGPCLPQEHCGPQTLATIKPHPEIVEACAPLYAAIEELAHTNEACSPANLNNSDSDDTVMAISALGNAVRLEVAPLAARGQLGEAAERVLDAMRFADDYGRKSTILGAMFAAVVASRMVDTLDELAIDPRLTAGDTRAIARDLDTLLASAPRWDAIVRQEQAWTAKMAASWDKDMVPMLARIDAQARGIHRVCSGTLRDFVEHLDEVNVDGGFDFKSYAQRFGRRDAALVFVRMQIELRLARPEACADPVRRHAILEPWADHVVVGNEHEPVVMPPIWQRDPQDPLKHVPRMLHCVPTTL